MRSTLKLPLAPCCLATSRHLDCSSALLHIIERTPAALPLQPGFILYTRASTQALHESKREAFLNRPHSGPRDLPHAGTAVCAAQSCDAKLYAGQEPCTCERQHRPTSLAPAHAGSRQKNPERARRHSTSKSLPLAARHA